MEQLQLSTTLGSRPGQRIIHLAGPLTIGTFFDFQKEVREDKSSSLILDFSAVPYVDSAGLGSVLGAYVSRERDGRKLALVGVSERVRTIFHLTRVEQFFQFYASVPAAELGLEGVAHASGE